MIEESDFWFPLFINLYEILIQKFIIQAHKALRIMGRRQINEAYYCITKAKIK